MKANTTYRLKTSLCALSLLLLTVLALPLAAQGTPLPVERYALYVASNEGGAGRETLKYAVTDAQRLALTMAEIGGVKSENTIILSEPSRQEILQAFASLSARITERAGSARRTEFLFYYSGHSDEQAFLLGGEKYEYSSLKADLAGVPTDVHVVMLDSCFSGNFVRAKGGEKDKPFLMDDSSVVQGHAYLSSSSATEASLESDRIQASFFTQALVTGLRGAADSSGDGKVSLNELYHYAFNDTLSQTQLSSVGPQHPSYNITLVGSGDLVLTDINEAESALILNEQTSGRYFIRTITGLLVSEITKVPGTAMILALPAGSYTITSLSGNSTSQTTITLLRGQRQMLAPSGFTPVPRLSGRSRGEGYDEAEITMENDEAKEWLPFSFSFFPGMMYPGTVNDNVNISVSPFMVQNRNIYGIQASAFIGDVTENMDGVQAAGFANRAIGRVNGVQAAGFGNLVIGGFSGVQSAGFINIADGDSEGIQAAGFLNIAKDFEGIQASGFLNIAKNVDGIQVGIINVAKSNTGLSLGLLNFIADGIISPSFTVDNEGNGWVQYKGGTRHFYTILMAGAPLDQSGDFMISGFGIGNRLMAERGNSLDLEIFAKQYLLFSELETLHDKVKRLDPENPDDQLIIEEAFERHLSAYLVPSARLTFTTAFFRHFGFSLSAALDVKITGFNERAFALGDRREPYEIAGGRAALYPVFSAGITF